MNIKLALFSGKLFAKFLRNEKKKSTKLIIFPLCTKLNAIYYSNLIFLIQIRSGWLSRSFNY